ncbi:hypothetical protein ACP275_13G031200 [Erythranthe tilingii]
MDGDQDSPFLRPLERRRLSTLINIWKDHWITICVVLIFGGIWFSTTFNVDMPKLYLQQIYVPALDLSENPTAAAAAAPVNPTLFFDIRFENPMADHSNSYGDGEIAFFYGPGRSLRVANYTLGGFNLDAGKTAYRRGLVEGRGVPWDGALGAAAIFGVEVAVKVRFGYWFWYSNKRPLRVGGDVEVGPSGRKVRSEDVPLTSAANMLRGRRFSALTFVAVSLLLVSVV